MIGRTRQPAQKRTEAARQAGASSCSGPRRVPLVVAVVVLIALAIAPANAADNLASALAHAYRNSPELQAERFRQRATDEQLPQAQSGWRPTIEASTSLGVRHEDEGDDERTSNEPVGFKVTLRQPIFRGFRTQASTGQALQNIAAGRQELLSVEQEVLLQAVTSYVDVVRARDVVRLRHNQVGILGRELKAAQGRFELGEITRTDVSQALSRFQSAITNHESAQADLQVAAANFLRYVGRAAGRLKRPGLPRALPRSLAQAVNLAEQYNPEIKRAMHNEVAARHFVKFQRGALLPSAALEAEYGYNSSISATKHGKESAVLRGVLTVPLYQSGLEHSRLREAKELASRQRMLILHARRKVRGQVMRAWSRYNEARQKIQSIKRQVGAAITAVEGVRRETLLGTRTTQDTLDAERELMTARIALADARRDHTVKAYEVLAAIGRLTARDLGLDVATYDADAHYRAVDGKWYGIATGVQ